MRWTEQLREDRGKIRGMETARQKLTFIWDYYKFPILAALLALLVLLAVLIGGMGRSGVSMYVVLINNDSLAVECDAGVFDEALRREGYDAGRKKADVNADLSLGREGNETEDMETMQVLSALFMVSSVDVYVSDSTYFDYFAQYDAFADLSLLIDRDLLASVPEEDLYYYENSGGNRILAGLWLRDGSLLHEAGYYHKDVVIGAVAGGENLDASLAFLRQVLADRN